MIAIRQMRETDAEAFVREECAQGWHSSVDKFRMRLRDQAAGKCTPLVAELDGEPAGYLSVYFSAEHGPFRNQGIPELVDFAVLEKFRRRGVGSALMDAAEEIAFARSRVISIGVGLHAGYGSAQRMYVRRGYIPDGSGVWFEGAPAKPYAPCVNGDDLVLYFSRER